MLTVEDVDLIGSLVRASSLTDYVVVVDLGAGSGASALAALCARSERLRVMSFDIDQVALGRTAQAVADAGYSKQWRGFTMAAHDAARYWEPKRRRITEPRNWLGVDILLHDAGHEAGNVARDIRAWVLRLVPGARIWVHDYEAAPEEWDAPPYPAVKRDVDQLVEDGVLRTGKLAGMGWSGRYTPGGGRTSRRERRAAERKESKQERREGADA